MFNFYGGKCNELQFGFDKVLLFTFYNTIYENAAILWYTSDEAIYKFQTESQSQSKSTIYVIFVQSPSLLANQNAHPTYHLEYETIS